MLKVANKPAKSAKSHPKHLKSRCISTKSKQQFTKRKTQLFSKFASSQNIAFSTIPTTVETQSIILPKIPKLSYLKYDSTTDILGLLKSRGFINQVTAGIEQHFNSEADLSPLSITETLTALGSSLPAATGYITPSIYTHKSELTSSDDTAPISAISLRQIKKFQKRSVYAGFDPTASSLHLGNLLVILSLMHFHKAGHQVVALTGGATGMVGDPSGRSTERVLQTADQVKSNVSQINKSLLRLLKGPVDTTISNTDTNTPIFVDNFDWYHNMSVIDFLRDVGKHFRVASMLSKDSVKSRMNNPESSDGISFTEFSYQVLQGYDYNYLHRQHNVTLQVGGSDQWGNITAGIDCVHRTKQSDIKAQPQMTDASTQDKANAKKNKKPDTTLISGNEAEQNQKEQQDNSAYGLTLPLLTTAQGVKFGKSMGNAIWINPHMTSSYQMYQYLLSTSDLDCRKFLNVFTFLAHDSIENIMAEHEKLPDLRIPQRVLACEIVRLLHGDTGVKQALAATKLLFKDKYTVDMSMFMNTGLNPMESAETVMSSLAVESTTPIQSSPDLFEGLTFDEFITSLDGVSLTHIPSFSSTEEEKIETHPLSIVNLAVATKLVASKSEAKRLIKQNGLSVYQDKVKDDYVLNIDSPEVKSFPFGRVVMLKAGQKKIHLAILPLE